MNVWNWWVRREFLDPISSGTKPLEARLNRGEFARARVGDVVMWNDRVKTRIKAVRRYQSFKVMLAIEKPEGFYPGANRDMVLSALRGMYRTEPTQGVLCFELERIN